MGRWNDTVTVQTDCSEVSKAGASIIFIEKRRSSSSSLEDASASSDLSGRTRNVFLTKMNALLPAAELMSSLSEL